MPKLHRGARPCAHAKHSDMATDTATNGADFDDWHSSIDTASDLEEQECDNVSVDGIRSATMTDTNVVSQPVSQPANAEGMSLRPCQWQGNPGIVDLNCRCLVRLITPDPDVSPCVVSRMSTFHLLAATLMLSDRQRQSEQHNSQLCIVKTRAL